VFSRAREAGSRKWRVREMGKGKGEWGMGQGEGGKGKWTGGGGAAWGRGEGGARLGSGEAPNPLTDKTDRLGQLLPPEGGQFPPSGKPLGPGPEGPDPKLGARRAGPDGRLHVNHGSFHADEEGWFEGGGLPGGDEGAFVLRLPGGERERTEWKGFHRSWASRRLRRSGRWTGRARELGSMLRCSEGR
jgi:hypothetical protein